MSQRGVLLMYCCWHALEHTRIGESQSATDKIMTTNFSSQWIQSLKPPERPEGYYNDDEVWATPAKYTIVTEPNELRWIKDLRFRSLFSSGKLHINEPDYKYRCLQAVGKGKLLLSKHAFEGVELPSSQELMKAPVLDALDKYFNQIAEEKMISEFSRSTLIMYCCNYILKEPSRRIHEDVIRKIMDANFPSEWIESIKSPTDVQSFEEYEECEWFKDFSEPNILNHPIERQREDRVKNAKRMTMILLYHHAFKDVKMPANQVLMVEDAAIALNSFFRHVTIEQAIDTYNFEVTSDDLVDSYEMPKPGVLFMYCCWLMLMRSDYGKGNTTAHQVMKVNFSAQWLLRVRPMHDVRVILRDTAQLSWINDLRLRYPSSNEYSLDAEAEYHSKQVHYKGYLLLTKHAFQKVKPPLNEELTRIPALHFFDHYFNQIIELKKLHAFSQTSLFINCCHQILQHFMYPPSSDSHEKTLIENFSCDRVEDLSIEEGEWIKGFSHNCEDDTVEEKEIRRKGSILLLKHAFKNEKLPSNAELMGKSVQKSLDGYFDYVAAKKRIDLDDVAVLDLVSDQKRTRSTFKTITNAFHGRHRHAYSNDC